MEFDVEKFVSPFIERQFPRFYQEEGPDFILFMKAYFEWMEDNGNPIGEARNLYDYRDIDNTLDDFLEHFQKKYLYGIPFNVIINKRFLLKHILDVYRSKGSIQCYRLLFKLIYNQDIDIYLPGRDLLAPSDGTWIQPRYLEVSDATLLPSLIGKQIIGMASGTTAIVESINSQPINQSIVRTIQLSNISPRGGSFVSGEKIVDLYEKETTDDLATLIGQSPVVVGSLATVSIINGGQGFKVGSVLKIAHRDVTNNAIISFGIDGLVKVDSLTRAQGAIGFDIAAPGFGITLTPTIKIYNGNTDVTGNGASFSVQSLAYTQPITYNTDLICDHMTQVINAATYGMIGNSSGNSSSLIGNTFGWATDTFGSLASLTNINTGNGYTQPVNIFVRSVELSQTLPGTISYNNTSNTITGTSTNFTYYFGANDMIVIQANTSLSNTIEYHVIKSVANDTSITLYGQPTTNSTASATFKAAPPILPANFDLGLPIMTRTDGTINGLNTLVTGLPSTGNSIVGTVSVLDSGKGYVDNELVKLYLYSGITTPQIISGGVNYKGANSSYLGDPLVFSGGGTSSTAKGYVSTVNGNGTITSISMSDLGSGYQTIPTITVQSNTGSGAIFSTSLTEFNTSSVVIGRVVKGGQGFGQGYWSTTKGFLNSDKYIQDDYFYQDFSYQIKVASQLTRYKDILYNTFHIAGTELFGEYQVIFLENSNNNIIYENTTMDVS